MKRMFASAFLLILAAIGSSQTPVIPMGPTPIVVPPQGVELLRWTLSRKGLEPVSSIHEILAGGRPSRSVLILMGNPIPEAEISCMQQFVRDGGALLYSSDFQCEELIPTFGVYITGKVVQAPPQGSFQLNPQLPLARGTRQEGGQCFRDAAGAPLAKLATNKPSSIRRMPVDTPYRSPVWPSGNPALARRFQSGMQGAGVLPAGSRYTGQLGTIPHDLGEFDPREDHLAMAGVFENGGRAFFLSDPSMVTNQLMVRGDTDNMEFAERLVDWLSEGPDGKRDLCLFIHDMAMQPRFDLPMPDMPLPPLNDLANIVLQNANKVIVSMEEDDFFNSAIGSRIGLRRILRGWYVWLLVGGIVWLAWRSWKARHGVEGIREKTKGDDFFSSLQASRIGRHPFLRACYIWLMKGATGWKAWRAWKARHEATGKTGNNEPPTGSPHDLAGKVLLMAERGDYTPAAKEILRTRFAEWSALLNAPLRRSTIGRALAWYDFHPRRDLKRLWTFAFSSASPRLNRKAFDRMLRSADRLEQRIATRSLPSGPAPLTRIA